jgi:hypothetical protein
MIIVDVDWISRFFESNDSNDGDDSNKERIEG